MAQPESIDDYNDRMTRESHRDWGASNGTGRRTSQEVQVYEQVQHPPVPSAHHPLEVAPVEFKHSLQVRGQNRATLVQWLKDALAPGIDYGRIHYVAKSKCGLGADCKNPSHFTKDTLFKAGAQKICGMLGCTPLYPNLGRYEEAALAGTKIDSIIIRCQIVSIEGRVIAEGVGARSLAQDYGDLNKALKMACKSAHVDATLCMAGLSEIFSHPESPPPPAGTQEEVNHAIVPAGNFKGQYWADMTVKYLEGVIAHPNVPKSMREGAQAEIDRRPKAADFDDDIPF